MATEEAPVPLRVLIVDDHPPICDVLAHWLRGDTAFAVVGSALDGATAIRLAVALRPDLLVLDLHLPDLPAVEVLRPVRSTLPDLRVLIYTGSDHVADARELLRLGVRGWLHKRAGREQLLPALRSIAQGREVFEAGMMEALLAPAPDRLTRREREVLDLIDNGCSNAEIARQLVLAPKTVEMHVSHILAKLGAESRCDALHIACERHLLDRSRTG